MAEKAQEVWDTVTAGLPTTPSPSGQIPIPEIIRVIEFCLDSRIEQFNTALDLLKILTPLRNDLEFLNWKAMIENDAKSYVASLETAEQILEKQQTLGTYFNAGRVAYKANQLQKSKEYLEKALGFNTKDSSVLLDLAVTICTLGDFEQALDIIEGINIDTLDETHSKIVEFNKGWHYIRLGNFRKGIDCLHIGREINVWGSDARKYPKPRWDGITRPGATILIVGEGGIGDEIINARFSETIQQRGMNCVMSSCHNNVSMLSSVKTLDKVFKNSEIDNEKWDFWAPCMDLPYILKIDSTDIPSKPYISAKPEYIEKWKKRINSNKFKIGIRWMGNPRYELELHRTIPLSLFEQLMSDDVQLYSIQKDDGVCTIHLPRDIDDISNELENWDDTMGAMMNMDLIITSCTSVAHVAAALGVETWVVVPLLPYYTWADMKRESYWYDSASIYRQKEWRKWEAPFIEIKQDLTKKLEKV